ncbi:ABC transporter ATP-binding protein [Lachnoclostridium sp. An181]|uniref:ABC transporter ATP-binding protein n=1 Tax=Lachnoclostridium sp. An181 TaxID=1965575 RepID=UPI000B382689|nr:ABC transporter ATP-binding protein [Lachnoclostridium sp. An181]OUP51348.1 peptide ABC transporter ATP-binding protein [Lachnoclostridium sp. An181]
MISLIDVKKTYTKNQMSTDVLKGINLTINQGDIVCIMGVSGSGKSTLLNIISGLLPLTSGEYYYKDKKLNTNNYNEMEQFRHNNIGIILQEFALIEDFSVYENIALPLRYQKNSSKFINNRTSTMIKKLGLEGKENYYPDELSGGQQQRVAIARALTKEPELIIADEPTGCLDEHNTHILLDIFKELNQQGITIIIATHDKVLSSICNKIFYLKNGLIKEVRGNQTLS